MAAVVQELSKMVSLRQITAMMGVSLTLGERMKASGRLPRHVALSRTLHRWHRDEIERWIAAGCPARHEWEAMKAKP
jgi:predicted DNA-binding transcriptional regulator AlpA